MKALVAFLIGLLSATAFAGSAFGHLADATAFRVSASVPELLAQQGLSSTRLEETIYGAFKLAAIPAADRADTTAGLSLFSISIEEVTWENHGTTAIHINVSAAQPATITGTEYRRLVTTWETSQLVQSRTDFAAKRALETANKLIKEFITEHQNALKDRKSHALSKQIEPTISKDQSPPTAPAAPSSTSATKANSKQPDRSNITPPATHNGRPLTGCSGGFEYSCCSYSGDGCAYILCREAGGKWAENTSACM
ncbi:hypothetical protein [Corallococcus sp. AS-1-6]|uniref:hypothetical protein n=1 Tax=Corallococcus sp. AS-1-6 TaxID=2874599 RepID=UPI001CBC2F1F|nr:hypothetical protein [Corallococcus sp. AS-1-6]MBZ4373254.1 hypothetical protein [Corallococcus sp. AS-1-6]